MADDKMPEGFRVVLNAIVFLFVSIGHIFSKLGRGLVDLFLLMATLIAAIVRRDEERARFLGAHDDRRFRLSGMVVPAVFALGFLLGGMTGPLWSSNNAREVAAAGQITAISYYDQQLDASPAEQDRKLIGQAVEEQAVGDHAVTSAPISHASDLHGQQVKLVFADPEDQAREAEIAATVVKQTVKPVNTAKTVASSRLQDIEPAAGDALDLLAPEEKSLPSPEVNRRVETVMDETVQEDETDPLIKLAGLRDIFTSKRPPAPAHGVMNKPVQAKPVPIEDVLTVGRGDVLIKMLTKEGIDKTVAHRSVIALKDVYDPRGLRPGDEIHLLFEDEAKKEFIGMRMDPDVMTSVSVALGPDGLFKAHKMTKSVSRKVEGAAGTITTSLFNAGIKAGMPVEILVEMIKLYSWDVDFQRDLRPGDSFEVLYERLVTEDGQDTGQGNILYARMTLSGVDLPLYRYELADGRVDYFNAEGKSAKRALMMTPINGARLSSGFGMRKHPILGYSKMHKGTDFAAPTGTPIYAAGDGVIEMAGRNGGYGNYVRIRHRSDLHTAYAHMSKFAKGIKKGKRVKQGEVIGYVGTTGRSTGPHLHYEVLINRKQVNPRAIKLPTGETLKGKELEQFKMVMAQRDQEFSEIGDDLLVASQ